MKHSPSLATLIVLFAVCAVSFSGCAPSQDSSQSRGTTAPVELMMWIVGSEGQAQTIVEISKRFTERTGVKVRCEATSWGEAHSKYLTSIVGGVAPDIGTMGLTWGMEFGKIGAMVDLAAAYPGDIAAIKRDVYPGMWGSIEHRGTVYGIPFDMTEYLLYYRTDIVPAAPVTWEELTKVLAGLNAKGKGMLIDWGSLSWIGFSPFLWQAGGDYYDGSYSTVTIDTPESAKALTFFSELYTVYKIPKTKIPLEQGMRTGDFPIAISGNWMIDRLRLLAPEITGKWAIAPLPKGPTGKRTSFIGGRILGIFEQSKHKKEAWEFIKFLFDPATQHLLYKGAFSKQDTYLPSNRKTWPRLDMDELSKSVLTEQAADAKGPPPVLGWDTSTKYVDEAIQTVILQGADVKTALVKAKSELERVLARH